VKPAILDTLDNIFNASSVKINGALYPLRFTLKAELWLERQGIRLDNLAGLMAHSPLDTSLKLVFAALPPTQYRERIEFNSFVEELSEDDARGILSRVNAILSAFFNHVLAVLSDEKNEELTKPKVSEKQAKQNLLDVINFLAVHFHWDYQKIGELTRAEVKELCEAYSKYLRERRAMTTLDNLNNLRATAPLAMPNKRAVEAAARASEERARELIKELEREQKPPQVDIDKAMKSLDKQFEGM